MNPPSATLLRVTKKVPSLVEKVIILGRDIRTSTEKISRYCLMGHEPVYEDLTMLVESMAFCDRLFARRRSEGWPRQLSIRIPVYEHEHFTHAVETLTEAAQFLTGDLWSFEFLPRKGPTPERQGSFALPRAAIRQVIPFSDGLDSFAQAQLSVREYGRDSVLLVRSGLARDRIFPKLASLRVPRRFCGARMREVSYRTRPMVFYTFAAIAAAVTQAEAVVIGENGQGAISPACLPFADEWRLRSAHPSFVRRWANFLRIILERPIRFEQPQLWKTKGEVLSNLHAMGLSAGWELTNSCSTRHQYRYGHRSCGICGGCLLRAVSGHAAGLASPSGSCAFNVHALYDVALSRDGEERPMTPNERNVAVRSIATMVEFSRLLASPDGAAAVDREARLIDPDNFGAVQAKLRRLLEQHRSEWDAFVCDLPDHSWVREIIGQL
jgi:7-cyano-7-deazaguanine synthase in queuosine biosynthesis